MADETDNPDRSDTENYGLASDASQPIRARNCTGSSLCHIIKLIIINPQCGHYGKIIDRWIDSTTC